MNIFIIDHNPMTAAVQHVDSHVRKMLIELGQLLSTAHRILDADSIHVGIYEKAYENHPCAKWVRESSSNYVWTFNNLVFLHEEYEYRFGKVHASKRVVPFLENLPKNIADIGITNPALAMPDKYKNEDAVESYRNYYRYGKSHLHSWTKRGKPEWI